MAEPQQLASAVALLSDPEWFVRKAPRLADQRPKRREVLGGQQPAVPLREHARRAPGEVAAWLEPRAARASPVTLREAVRYLAPDDREAIAAAAA